MNRALVSKVWLDGAVLFEHAHRMYKIWPRRHVGDVAISRKNEHEPLACLRFDGSVEPVKGEPGLVVELVGEAIKKVL